MHLNHSEDGQYRKGNTFSFLKSMKDDDPKSIIKTLWCLVQLLLGLLDAYTQISKYVHLLASNSKGLWVIFSAILKKYGLRGGHQTHSYPSLLGCTAISSGTKRAFLPGLQATNRNEQRYTRGLPVWGYKTSRWLTACPGKIAMLLSLDGECYL